MTKPSPYLNKRFQQVFPFIISFLSGQKHPFSPFKLHLVYIAVLLMIRGKDDKYIKMDIIIIYGILLRVVLKI